MNKSKMLLNSEKLELLMCRICHNKKGDVPIFYNPAQPNIPEEIFNFSGVTVSEMDNLPQNMCQCCLNLLNGCIMFRDICQKTNKTLVELSIKIKESSNIDGIIHEGDIDNFKHQHDDGSKIIKYETDFDAPSPELYCPDVHKCTLCNSEFSEIKTYHRHLKFCQKPRRQQNKNKDQECDKHLKDCKKPPKRRRRRRKVIEQSFVCDTCGKIYSSKNTLQNHLSIHDNTFPFKCDECPYRGRNLELLRVHQRSHMAEKPYKCTQCPKTTTTSSNLKRHMVTHSVVKPFKCSYCNGEFVSQPRLKVHVKWYHLSGPVECDICYNKYQSRKKIGKRYY